MRSNGVLGGREMPWGAISYVSSGFTLVAFIIATVAWIVKNHSEEKRKLIELASEDARAGLVDQALDLVRVDTSGLSKEQRYDLAIVLINKRAERLKVIVFLVCFLAVLGCGTAIYSHGQKNGSHEKKDEKSVENVMLPYVDTLDEIREYATEMSEGPIDNVRFVLSKSVRLAKNIEALDLKDDIEGSINQSRGAAAAWLYASDASESISKQLERAQLSIDHIKKTKKILFDTKKNNAILSAKLEENNCLEMVNHLYYAAVITFDYLGDSRYNNKETEIINEIDREYYRKFIGDNYKLKRTDRLNKIKRLWERGE